MASRIKTNILVNRLFNLPVNTSISNRVNYHTTIFQNTISEFSQKGRNVKCSEPALNLSYHRFPLKYRGFLRHFFFFLFIHDISITSGAMNNGFSFRRRASAPACFRHFHVPRTGQRLESRLPAERKGFSETPKKSLEKGRRHRRGCRHRRYVYCRRTTLIKTAQRRPRRHSPCLCTTRRSSTPESRYTGA